MTMSSLLDRLDRLTMAGELVEVVDAADNRIRCTACAHRCLIKDGRRGICQVRYNDGGVLRVPHGYVGALQVDPTAKKPFYHVLPGSLALSFGMLGCDLHCSYCFVGETVVVTDRGLRRLNDLFADSGPVEVRSDGAVAYPDNLRTIAGSGMWREVRAVFKHPYRGKLAIVQPYYLPSMRCTADHRVYATADPAVAPAPIRAEELTTGHYLAVPRRYPLSMPKIIDVAEELADHQVTYQVPWKLSLEERAFVVEATARGETSRQIGATLGVNPSYIRHVRSKIARGRGDDQRTRTFAIEDGRVRFPNEHRPGVLACIPLDEDMARLLGYYCAEGSIFTSKSRPNSHTLGFSFGPEEADRPREVQELVRRCLGVKSHITRRETTLAVDVTKTSAALLFQSLAGKLAQRKRVPESLLDAPRPVVEAFLDAFVAGDGHRYPNGKVSISTVSHELAYGIAWLALRLGFMPSIYDAASDGKGQVLGRDVNRAPHQYTVVWYATADVKRRLVEQEDYYLVPLRDVTFEDFEGDVYNMEVEEEHNYLAGFFLVKNCQNWDISQFGRDERAGRDPLLIDAAGLVNLALQRQAAVVASTYNEPLITTEWAVEIFKLAKARGLKTVYVSNGNATPEALAYLRPHLDAYKIDLKSMRDKPYRELGTVLQHVLDTIQRAHELGFWVEIVTLIVPGFNDSNEELWDAARFIAGVSPDIPWHVTAFHPDYKLLDPPRTSVETVIRAAEIGSEAGLHYVYAGNVPGSVGEWEDTRCPACQTTLIRRYGFQVIQNRISATGGTCPQCGAAVAGVWA